MDLDAGFALLVVGSFVAAVFNAAFSAGGAMIILAVTSTVLPVSAVVPIHSTLLLGSTTMRVLLFREFVDWKIVWPFLLGSIAGANIGAQVYFELPDRIIGMAIAGVMLVAIWLPQVSWRPKIRHPWLVVGFLHSLLSTMFAYGAIFQSVILHTKLERRQIIGTAGGCLTGMGLFKISAYATNGFDYIPFLQVIAASVAVSFAGTWLGRQLVDRMSEKFFRLAYRVLITVTALRLLYVQALN